MALAPLATVAELAARLRKPLTGDDATWAELVLASVSSLVRDAAGKTWEGTEVPATAKVVTIEVAARVYANPDSAASSSVTTGPFGKTVTWANPRAVGMYLTPDDRSALSIRRGTGLWTLGTSRNGRNGPTGVTGYVPVEGSPNPFPWYGDDVVIP